MSNLELIYLCAVRYGLGRRTYITGVISDFMINKYYDLTPKCISIMIRDIEDAQKEDRLGDDCDKKEWLKLLKYLKK